ncbi:MAG: hypothetical protein IPG45_07950 [Deltaproteobacteria bacterium]|nr:hypothetical protein [Deltaproteobacteria bacterium]
MKRAAFSLAAAGALATFTSCVILIKPPTPVPIPVPLSCSTQGQKTAHIIFSTRINRTTVNLSPGYESFMIHTMLALAGAKVMPSSVVLVRSDERTVDTEVLAAWGCNVASSPDTALQPAPNAVINYYAQNDTLRDPAEGCMSDSLLSVGDRLTEVTTSYPNELPGGRSGLSVFSTKPDVVLVVHMDALERKAGFEEPACRSTATLAAQGEDGALAWLSYAGADPAPQEVVHWFVTTDEGLSDSAFFAECKKADGIDTGLFDSLQPSAKAFYGPLAQSLEASGQHTAVLPICRMLANQDLKFLVDEALHIGDELGTSPDATEIEETINGGFDALINQQIPQGTLNPDGRPGLGGLGG